MRDPNRLNDFYEQFKYLHKACYPDLRFGQLCMNFFYWLSTEKGIDAFFPEEEKMLDLFKEYCQMKEV